MAPKSKLASSPKATSPKATSPKVNKVVAPQTQAPDSTPQMPSLPPPPLTLPDITKAILNDNKICNSYGTAFECNKNITCFWGAEDNIIKAAESTGSPDPSMCNSKCRDNEYWSSDGCVLFTQ